jgi:hypothetical protein
MGPDNTKAQSAKEEEKGQSQGFSLVPACLLQSKNHQYADVAPMLHIKKYSKHQTLHRKFSFRGCDSNPLPTPSQN